MKICSPENWTKTTLDSRVGITDEFKYSTLGIHIQTGILPKVCRMNRVDFANRSLSELIGSTSHHNY